jgi:phage terminase large subunit-like protein
MATERTSSTSSYAKGGVDNLNEALPGRPKHESYLLQYRKAILSGEIIAGQELIQTLNNLVADIDNPEYTYDTRDSDFRIDFIERFCRHTKSPFHGKPFILELWEKALIEAFYSFKWTATGFRRFRKCLLLIARKNGKSTLCAALALTEFMVGLGGIDIVCSSNDDAQADLIFQEVANMREGLDPKSRRTHKNLRGIFHRRAKSTIKKLSDKTRNKEGRNIDYAYLDEVHEMETNVIGKSIEQSQSTKDEPGLWQITTEGFVNDGYLDKELKYARAVMAGDIEDPTLLVWLYTQDSEVEIWQDERSWAKSNPSLGVIKKRDYIQGQLRKAQHDKTERVFTLAKDFNIKQNNAAAWLSEAEVTNRTKCRVEEFRGAVAIGAADLSETTDLTCAKVLIMRKGDPKKYFLTKYFIPEAKVAAGEIEDKKNYLEWAKEGLVEITPGNENDFSLVTKWFVDLYKTYGIRCFKVGYDNALAKFWVDEMEELGFDMERIRMDKFSLSNPMKLVEADLRSQLLIYNDNPIDRWCLGNTALKVDSLGLIMPVKVNDMKNRRIDGAVTKIIAYAAYMRYRTDYLNLVR